MHLARLARLTRLRLHAASESEIEAIKRLPANDSSDQTFPVETERSIASLASLGRQLRGFPTSRVWVRVARQGGWREYEVEVPRKVLPSLAGSYL